jgi:hypothetical protein
MKKSQKRTAGGIAGAVIGAIAGGVAGAMVGDASAKGKKPLKRAAEAIRTEINKGTSLETVKSLVGDKNLTSGTKLRSTSGTKKATSRPSGVKKKPTTHNPSKKAKVRQSSAGANKRKKSRAPKRAKKKR